MASEASPNDPLQGFTGQVRLFPLPKLVMFPHVLQKLHIYEPRYRTLLCDALAGDGMFALVTALPAWACHGAVCQGMARTGCLGKVVEHEPLGDGRSNILFTGLSRVRLVGECSSDKPYRIARAEIQSDKEGIGGEQAARRLQNQLREAVSDYSSAAGLFTPPICQTLTATATLGVMTDVLAFTLPLDEWAKLDLLAETHVVRRARLLLDMLRNLRQHNACTIKERTGVFPAKFSIN